jgi:hypothetical protein
LRDAQSVGRARDAFELYRPDEVTKVIDLHRNTMGLERNLAG